MKALGPIITLFLLLSSGAASAQADKRDPHIGYLYPSGGQKGTVVRVTVGGQYLRGITEVVVSGEGVRASMVRYNGRVRRLNGEERRELARRLTELGEKRKAGEKSGKTRDRERPARGADGKGNEKRKGSKDKDSKEKESVKLPNHPLLNELESLTPPEIEMVTHEFLRFDRKKQPNTQIAETAVIEVTIDDKALAGDRELRLRTPLGLTNPLCFQVGDLPEICEPEPYDTGAKPGTALDQPILLNGQIKPGDVDRFRFMAKEGQKLVIEVQARHLIPYLADAVPGWFQATLALFDESGKEVAYVDDYGINPDPVLFFEVPSTGNYDLEVRDSIYRGREDFVYRIAVGTLPFIRSLFPLGGPAGGRTVASIDGWNLSSFKLPLDTAPGTDSIREATSRQGDRFSNAVAYAVGDLPECIESEPNGTLQNAMKIKLPRTINGRILEPGDEDIFRFRGQGGAEVVVDVTGRRMNSPIDSLVRLIDSKGRVLAWNDDHEHKEQFLHRDMGLITHHADSYLRARLPRSGIYYIQISDSQRHGGPQYGYRLRVSPPQPDFALLVTPSTLNVGAGRSMPLAVHVLRKDGFDGPIDLSLKDAPPGFVINGGHVPGNCQFVRLTLTAPLKPSAKSFSLQFQGTAKIDGRSTSRLAVPADDVMQAFLYRHLVPCQELVVAIAGARARSLAPKPAGDLPVRIPAGGRVTVRYNLPRRGKVENISLKLSDPPQGVSVLESRFETGYVEIVLQADREKAQGGSSGNLIFEAFTERAGRDRKGKSTKKKRISLGVLPAVPFEIVGRSNLVP